MLTIILLTVSVTYVGFAIGRNVGQKEYKRFCEMAGNLYLDGQHEFTWVQAADFCGGIKGAEVE